MFPFCSAWSCLVCCDLFVVTAKLGLVTPFDGSKFDRSKLSLLSCIEKAGENLAQIYV